MTFIWIDKKLRRTIFKTVHKFGVSSYQLPVEYQAVIDSTRSISFRTLWFCVLLTCLILCCYQITDRVQYYLSYPVAVDIHIDYMQILNFPVVQICSPFNDYVNELLQNFDDLLACLIPLANVWNYKGPIDVPKLWEYGNKSNLFNSVDYGKYIILDSVELSSDIKSIFGQCTRLTIEDALQGKELYFAASIKFFDQSKTCSLKAAMASVVDKLDFAIIIPLLSGYIFDLRVIFRKYDFGNTEKHPCVSDEEFIKCYKNCVNKVLFEETTCRLPLYDKSINLPQCNSSSIARDSYFQAFKTYLVPKVYTRCNCTPTCRQYIFTVLPTILLDDTGGTTIKLAADQVEVAISQRIAYDGISLLVDTGGSLNLFMGLSLLAIADIIQHIIAWMSRSSKVNKLNRMEAFIFKMYLKCKRRNEALNDLKRLGNIKNTWLSYMWNVVLVLCFALAIFMIQSRAFYYFRLPTRNVVELEHLSYIKFPSLTVCGEDIKLPFLKKRLIQKKLTNITNWCDLQMLDLYKKEKRYTLEYLWKNTKLTTYEQTAKLLKTMVPIDLISANVSTIPTHLGDCFHYKFSEVEYNGFFSLFVIPFPHFEQLPSYECLSSAFKVFISDFESSGFETYDESTKIDSPIHATTANDFRMTTFQRLNISVNPCITTSDARKCWRACLIERLQKVELCKLPFLENINDNLPECESSDMAKKAVKEFSIIANNLTKSCSCVRPCRENMYFTNSYSQVQPPGQPFALVFLMLSNLVEHIIEVRQYTLIALCADVGNCFGLAVGMSVLSFIRYAAHPILWLHNRINRKL